MRENALKAKLRAGEAIYGLLSPNYDTMLVETLAFLGFDFYMIDCEHGPAGPVQVADVVRACEAAGITPMARVRAADPKLVLQFVDLGVMGVMLPGVLDVGDVRRLVEAVKYPPLGRRGIAPVRANDYLFGEMSQADYVPFSNDQTIILPQIETMDAVENLDGLLKVEGVDGYFVGPRDLAMAMGFADGPNHPELRDLMYSVFGRVTSAGLYAGTVAATGEDARTHYEHGARIIMPSVNNLLKQASAAFFKAARPGEAPPTPKGNPVP